MTRLEKIKQILDNKQEFLMYPGGSGGEFLAKNILKYSKKYTNPPTAMFNFPELNKTMYNMPEFFDLLSMKTPIDIISYNELLTNILNDPEYSDHVLTEAIDYQSKGKNLLIRCHTNYNEYFHNKTYYIHWGDVRWFNYVGILYAIKVKAETVNVIKRIRHEASKLDNIDTSVNVEPIIDYIKNSGLSMVNNIRFDVLTNKLIQEKPSIEYAFTAPIYELHRRYSLYILKTPLMRSGNVNRYLAGNMIFIDYRKLFSKGYLEDIFEIDNSGFNEELLEWHDRNLAVMSKFNFDHRPYILN